MFRSATGCIAGHAHYTVCANYQSIRSARLAELADSVFCGLVSCTSDQINNRAKSYVNSADISQPGLPVYQPRYIDRDRANYDVAGQWKQQQQPPTNPACNPMRPLLCSVNQILLSSQTIREYRSACSLQRISTEIGRCVD